MEKVYRVYVYIENEWKEFGVFKIEKDAKSWADLVYNHRSLNYPMVKIVHGPALSEKERKEE